MGSSSGRSILMKGTSWMLVAMVMCTLTTFVTTQQFPRIPRATCFSSIDLLIIMDSSGSIPFQSPYNWGTAKNLTKNYIDTLDISGDLVRVALIQVADDATVQFHFNTYTNPEDMKRKIDSLTISNQGKTNLADAFIKARTEIFIEENGERQGVQNAVIFISDGIPTLHADDTIPEAERLKQEKDATIVSFGISGEVNKTLLRTISTMHSEEIVSFDQFDLTKHILMDEKLDVCLIVDASGSINFLDPNNWFYAKTFLKSILRQLEIRTDGIRVGCVTFNETATLRFNLGDYNDRGGVASAIDRLPYHGGRTNLAAGLRLARTKVFELTGKFRTDRKSVALVITDGVPTDEIDSTQEEADNLKRGGVHVVSVVVKGNSQIDMSMLTNISSYSPTGSDRRKRAVVQVTDYASLLASSSSVIQRICMDSGFAPPPTQDPNALICYNTCNPPQEPQGLARGLYQYCESGRESIAADCNRYLICDGSNNGNNGNNGNNIKRCADGLVFDVVQQTCAWRSCTCPGPKRRCYFDSP